MKIGYISATDPFVDRVAWSGTIFKLREAIEKADFEVVWIPYKTHSFYISFLQIVYKIFVKIYKGLFHETIFWGALSPFWARIYAKSIDINEVNKCDYLFFPVGAQICAYLKSDVPIIFFSDATVPLMIDYYWFNVKHSSVLSAISLEKKAAQKSFINIRSSQWALDSVVSDYNCDKNKCFVLEFGPNIDSKDISPVSVYESGRLNILFSGCVWSRKGGDIAVKTVELLRQKGIDAHLLIVGPKKLPQEYQELGFIEYYGFLNKNNPSDYKKYIQLYKKSHIALLPTKAECSAIVFCEAAAFGLPFYTFDTGGTSSYVVNGYNGCTLSLVSSSEDFANVICNDINEGKMKLYHDNGLKLSREKLSWDAFAKRFKDIVLNCK